MEILKSGFDPRPQTRHKNVTGDPSAQLSAALLIRPPLPPDERQKYEALYRRNRVQSLVFRIIGISLTWPGYASMFFTNCMSITDTWARVAVVWGAKVPPPIPERMPLSTAQPRACMAQSLTLEAST